MGRLLPIFTKEGKIRRNKRPEWQIILIALSFFMCFITIILIIK